MAAIFKQKLVWIGTIIVLVVLIVFGVAMMGSVLGAKPNEIPVAFVMLDQSTQLPNGAELAVGEMMKQKLTANTQMPIAWTVVGSEEEARAGMDARQYYGALIVPADLSAGVASLASPAPKPATVKIIANEGLNAQAATVVKQQGLGQAMKLASAELTNNLLQQMGQQMQQVPIAAVPALLAPFQVQEETVHIVGANNASGSAPGLLTQLMWLGSLITAATLFVAGVHTIQAGGNRRFAIAWQPVLGVIITGVASAFLVWMAASWYGMELEHPVDTWLFLWLSASAFYMLQSALLNWIGWPAMGLLVLVMFFSMPLLNMPPEFLSQATQDWIYAWTPLRFVSGGLREVMYFGGLSEVGTNAAVLWSIAGVFLLLLLASSSRKGKLAVGKVMSAS